MEGSLAFALIIILGFGAFIVWAKSTYGQSTLKRTFGEPGGARRRTHPTRKHTPKSVKSNRPKTPSAR